MYSIQVNNSKKQQRRQQQKNPKMMYYFLADSLNVLNWWVHYENELSSD